MALDKIPFDHELQLNGWLKTIIPEELYLVLKSRIDDIISEFCKNQFGCVVLFDDKFKQHIQPYLAALITKQYEKMALEKISLAAKTHAATLDVTTLTTPAAFYHALTHYEYTEIKLHPVTVFPETIRVRKILTPDQQARLDLIKRAVSLWHAAELALPQEHHPLIKKEALAFITHIQTLPPDALASLSSVKQILNNELQHLSWEIATIMSVIYDMKEEEVYKFLKKTEGLVNWERQREAVASVSTSEWDNKTYLHIQLDSPYKMLLTPEQKAEYKRINAKNTQDRPAWFNALNFAEKHWLRINLDKIIRGELNCPSSLTRHLPGVTNFSKYSDIIANENNEIICDHSCIRRHTLSLTGNSAEDNERLTLGNAEQLFAIANPKSAFDNFWGDTFKQLNAAVPAPLFLDIGALTPLYSGLSWLIDIFPYQENNTLMQTANETAISQLRTIHGREATILGTNIAVNTERTFSENFLDYNSQQLTQNLTAYMRGLCIALSEKKHHKPELKQVFIQLRNLLNTTHYNAKKMAETITALKKQQTNIASCFFEGDEKKAGSLVLAFEALQDYLTIIKNHTNIDDTNNQGLFAAALLQIIAGRIGGAVTGGCKSAKDRWGTVLMQVSAMLIYYKKHGVLPKVYDQHVKRAMFVHEFSTVFRTGHQQHMASMNVYGANGTLDGTNPPTKFLQKIGVDFIPMVPEDIQKKIGEDNLKKHQMFAQSSKWKFKNPVSFFRQMLNDVVSLFHDLTCDFFNRNKVVVDSPPQAEPLLHSSPVRFAQLGGPVTEPIASQQISIASGNTPTSFADPIQIIPAAPVPPGIVLRD